MSLQQNIFGENEWVGPTSSEVRNILEKYPAAVDDPSHFYFLCLKETCPWICQMPQEKIMELRHFCRDIESLRRRRQEFKAAIPQ